MIPNGEGPLKPRRPWWFTLILVLLVLPSFGTPWILADGPTGSLLDTLVKWYPVYLVVSAVCAWVSYPQRRDVAWILVSLMILSAIAVFMV